MDLLDGNVGHTLGAIFVARGLAASRLTAVGIGEARPITTNDDESGRSLNRRVEVKGG